MSIKTVSVDLETENLRWLQSRANISGARNISKTLNEVLAKVRAGGFAAKPRSVRGTIRLPEADLELESAGKHLSEQFRRSLERTAQALAGTAPKA